MIPTSAASLGAGERLEPRQLLTLVVDAANLASFRDPSGDYLFADDAGVEFTAATVLDAGAGAIRFDSPSVTIGAHVQLITSGSFTIAASKTSPSFGAFSNLTSQVQTIVDAIKGLQTHVTVCQGATVTAGSVSIDATAGNDLTIVKALTSIPGLGGLIAFGINKLIKNDIYNLPISAQVKQPQTTIVIDAGAAITATSGDVTISAAATADARGQAIYSVLANDLAPNFGGGFAAGFSYVDASSTVSVAGSIRSSGTASIKSTTTGIAEMSSRVTLNQGLQRTNPSNIEVAYAGTHLQSTSRITVADGGTVEAGKNVAISSVVNDTNTLKANTASYRDGRAGVTIGTGWSYGTSEVVVDGSIRAGKVDVPRSLTFDPTFALEPATGALLLPAATDFHTGDEIRYTAGSGHAMSGLVDGRSYYAIVDPQNARRLRLAASAADALANRPIKLGTYPTLTTPKGTLPITAIDAAASDTIRFGVATWPDGSPLFTSGQIVRYAPAVGQFLGVNAADGTLAGPLAAADYVVRVVPLGADEPGTAIQLLKAGQPVEGGQAVDLNDNPLFRLADGSVLQVFSFDADSGQVNLAFPRQGSGEGEVPFPTPRQTVSLINGQPVTYTEAFGTHVPGLEDGRTYYAIVDQATPGLIRLAPTAAQAAAADPAIQQAAPKLETLAGRTLDIGSVEPGTGLVFAADPGLAAGTPVIYRAAPGKPVGGLVDGTTYFAYPQVNPFFEPEWPQYVVALRTAADGALPLVHLSLEQALVAGGIDYAITGVDATSGSMAIALPTAADAPAVDGSGLIGGTGSAIVIPAGSRQIWTTATRGSFTISLPSGASRVTTTPIPFDAPAAAVMAAINGLALPGVSATAAFGRGTPASPWTLAGTLLEGMQFDSTELDVGAAFTRGTTEGLVAVSSTASGGTFRLSFPGADRPTAAIPFDAPAAVLREAVNAIPGLLTANVLGSGSAADPWLVATRVQPIRTGDPLTFRDAWGSTSHGLLHGQTVYAVVQSEAGQGKAGSVIVSLAATRADALAADPPTLPLVSTVEFGTPQTVAMSGAVHALASPLDASGISISAKLTSGDQQSLKAANGGEPKLKDVLTRGDVDFDGSEQWKSILKYFKPGTSGDSEVSTLIAKQANGSVNEWFTISGSGSGLAIANTAHVVLGSSATLATSGKVSLTSSITETVKSNVEATVSKPNKGSLAVALAIDVVQVSNTARTIVGANASVTGGDGIVVDSKVAYPWAFQSSWLENWTKNLSLDALAKAFGGKFGLDEWFVNHWANAGVKQKNFKDAQLKTTVTASLSLVTFTNEATARIEDGARINADTGGISMPTQNPVSVTATTDIAQTGFAGLVYIDLSPDGIVKKLRKSDKTTNSLLVAAQGETSIGGSVGVFTVDNTTQAYVGGLETETVDGVTRPIRTPNGPLRLATGSAPLNVAATNSLLLLQLGQGGGDASSLGISGTAAAVDVKRQKADAAILGGSDPSRAAVIDAGRVAVNAADTSYVIPVAGAVMVSKNKGVGVSTAIALMNRDVAARIGGRDDETTGIGWLDTLSARGDVAVTAKAGGAVTPSALAAAVGSSVKAEGQAEEIDPHSQAFFDVDDDDVPAPTKGRFGLAVSGDYVGAHVTDVVQATVNTHGTLAAAGGLRSLSLAATNDTLLQATAGAAAFLSGDGSSLGLAGSAAVTTAASTVTALVRQATVQGFSADLRATNARRIGGLAASGSGATAGNSGTTSLQIVGSVVVNSITANTTARFDTVTGTGLGNLSVAAKADEKIWAAAGSFLFNFSPSGAQPGQTPGKSLGIGASVAVQNVTSTTTASLSDSVLEAATAAVRAADTSQLYTFAAGIVGTGAGSSLSGMWTNVTATPTVTALIKGGSLDVSGAAGVTSIDVAATSALLLVTAAGDLVIGRSSGSSYVAAGAAVAVVRGNATTDARVGRSARLRARRGNVSVSSRTRTPDADPAIDALLADFATPHRASNAIWTFAVGVVGSNSNLSLAGSWSDNRLVSNRSAKVAGAATITADLGNVAIDTADEAGIYSGAGTIVVAAGNSEKWGVGAAVSRNAIAATTRARLDGASVTTLAAGSAVTITATAASLIGAAAVGGEFAGRAGIGTSLVFNEISQTVEAGIGTPDAGAVTRGGVTAAGSLTVTATDRSRIGAGAGQVSVATKGVAAGAAAATNAITSTTTAVIERADVVATGSVTVKADAASTIYSYAVGVAGAFSETTRNFAGAGSGTGNTLVRRVLAAVRAQSALDVGGLSVTATDTSSIDTAAGTLAIQRAGKGGISAAIGVSASKNEIGSQTDAAKKSFVKAVIEDSTATVRGKLDLAATATLNIQAITAAGALAISSGTNWGINVPGAGAGSGNTIQLDVEAAVRSSPITLPGGGDFAAKARNDSAIMAVAGGVAVAGSSGGNKGINVSLGAAATVNEVTITTSAVIDTGGTVQTTGSVTLDAVGAAAIKAVSFGVAAALRGGPPAFDLTGAGSAAINTVRSETLAAVRGDVDGTAGQAAGAVSLTAVDRPAITAGAGGLSSVFNFGGGASAALSVGVSYTINDVSGSSRAVVDGGTVRSRADVSLSATFDQGNPNGTDGNTVFAVSVAGSVDASFGGGGLLFPLAGAGNRTTVAFTAEAAVTGGTVRTDGAVSLAAADRSRIYSNAGGVGIGLSFGGGSGGGVAIGAAQATTTVANTVRAAVESAATVEATGNVSLSATGAGAVDAVGYGVALSAAVAGTAGSLAGSGAKADTLLTNSVAAEILSAAVTSRSGGVSLSATDRPEVRSRAGAGALAVVIGNGVSLAAGVVILENEIRDTVRARVAAQNDTAAAPSVAAAGAVGLTAESQAKVTSLGVAVAAAATVGEFSGAFAGAGGRSTVTLGSTVAAEIVAGSVTGGSVSVTATDHDLLAENTFGSGALAIAIGLVGASIGVSLTQTTVSNTVSATIGRAQVTAKSGGITLDSRGGNTLATESVATAAAVALGGAGAGGHAFATDSSTFEARLATGAGLSSAGPLTVRARGAGDDAKPDGSIEAQAHGGSAGIAAVGVVIATATDATRRLATIGNDVDLSNVASLVLTATSNPNVKAWSVAADVGGVAVTVNQSTGEISGAAKATTGTGVTLPAGDVSILAAASTSLDVKQTGIVDGALAAGATQSTGRLAIATEASLGAGVTTADGRSGSLVVRATSRDAAVSVRAISGSGGLFAGFGTTGDLTDATTTRAMLAGGTIRAGSVDVLADRAGRYALAVDSTNITVGLGVGITRATFTADLVAADGIDRVRTAIGQQTTILATGPIGLAAGHRVERAGSGPTVDGVGGSLLVSGQQSVSNVIANVPATIEIGAGASLTSGTNPLTQPGGITILPNASLEVSDAVHLWNLGLLVSGGRMGSYLDATLAPRVTMGDDVRLTSHGRIDVGTTAFVAGGTQTNGWGAAIFGGVGTYAASNVKVDQAVRIGSRARFASDGSLSVTPGDDPTGASSTQLALDATARAVSRGLVALPFAKARSTLAHTSELAFGVGADVSSGGTMFLSGRAVAPTLTATGQAEGDILGIPKTDIDQQTTPSTSSKVTLAGTFVAGRESRVEITIPNDRSGGFTGTVQASPATVFGIPLAGAWKYLPDFNPQTYIDQAGFSADVAPTLRSGVAAGPVGAITFAPQAGFQPVPLVVSGGSVNVQGDTIDARGASLTGRTARITIKNESPDYLVLGRMTIANVEGGSVNFHDGSGETLADPQAISIARDSGTASITVEQTFAAGVGGSPYGPAVFLAQPVENLGGDVTIHNAKGSFGQTGTIAAKRITIDTPNGVFAVDTPTADWAAAGVPSAQWADSMIWPGGRPGRDQLNGNQAVMYAINAMDSPDGQGWRGATTDDQLNQWVYGDPLADRTTYVFFGGSVPQYPIAGNSQGVNEGLAAEARPDRQRSAWKMTDTTPKLGKNEGWDHAWMPKLQRLPSVFTKDTDALPAVGSGTAVRGQVILINAKTANINGTLEAGGDRAGDQSVVVPARLEATLLDYQRRYRLGEVTAPIYRIPDDQLLKAAATDRLIGASFDARTGRIVLDQATSSGGGSVSITGRIINTAGPVAGKIKVRGGSGNLTAQNDTSLPLVTTNLQTGTAGKQGIISITDLTIDDQSQQQTTYVYDGSEVRLFRGPRGMDLLAGGTPSDRIAGSQTTFSPRPDARWQWQFGARLTRSVNLNLGVKPYPGVDASGWTFANAMVTASRPWGPWAPSSDGAEGSVVFESNPAVFAQRISAPFRNDVSFLFGDFPSEGWPNGSGFSDRHPFFYPSEVLLDMTMSVKADWPIGIDFSGTSFGEIRVTSKGDLTIAGTTVAGRVVLDSSTGGISAPAGAGSIQATALEVRALRDIGSRGTPLRVQLDSIAGTSTAGGIWIDGRRGPPERPLVINGLAASRGTVRVVAAGDLATGTSGVTASTAEFESVAGGIGMLATPLIVTAGSGGTLRLDARAVRDVHVRQPQGDMLVGSVRSSGGSVILEATASILNADTWTIDPAAAAARIRQLEALGATDPDAYRADVAAFERNVTSRYTLYWSTRNNGDDLSLWRLRTAASLGITDPTPTTPTDAQIRAYVAGLRKELETFFAETVGADWQSRPGFQAYDPRYAYTATPQQIERFRANRTVTAAQLAIQLAARALDAPPPGGSVSGRVNIAGRDVTLLSNTGSVGKNDDPVTIPAADLAAGSLTDVQRQELALAASPGDARVVRTGDTVTAVVLNVRRPLVLDVTGRLDVDAPAGIAVAQKAGDLRVGRIGSRDGLVSVIADDSILNAPLATIDMWNAPIDFSRPEDWSLVGNGGQTVTVSGGLYIPGFKNSASGTWLKIPVPTTSFRATFTYLATSQANPGDGLAMVLAQTLPTTVGAIGGGLGYSGLPGPKAGFLVNIYGYGPNPPGTSFDPGGTWTGGGFQRSSFPLAGRPVYVALEYDATRRVMRTTMSDQPDGVSGTSQTFTYEGVDLAGLLGSTAFLGFTSGTGNSVTSQQITNLSFATGATIPGERVELPADGPGAWVVAANPADAGFTFTTPAEGPTATFADRTNAAAAAWYPTPVSVSRDFSVTFRYRHSAGADGMALVLQNANTPTTALGDGGGALGYSGIRGPKVGYLMNIFGTAGTRFDTTGSTGGYNAVSLLQSDTWITVTLTYDTWTKTITERLTTASGATYSKSYPNIDLVQLLGGTTATLGFTAASGWAGAKQDIQSLVFDSPAVPLPIDSGGSRGGWQLNGGVQQLANGMLVIPDATFTATSTWYERPVTTADFTASFIYEAQGTRPADGLAFVMQRSTAGLKAVGQLGAGLGYTGIPGPKVGLLVNVFEKPGVRLDTGGETGTFEPLPWLVGGPVSVQLVHDSARGTLTATLSRAGYAPFTKTWNIDLPAILGSQAFMGFTSGTGAFAATQTIRGFTFRDHGGIASDAPPAVNASPTVRLWSSYGSIGTSGDEIAIRGVLDARAPNGSIHTNPPPAPVATPLAVGGTRPDGTPVTNRRKLHVPLAAPGNQVVYSTDGGRSWRTKWLATEGMNVVLVAQVNTRGIRSAPQEVRFVLDTKAPTVPLVALRDRAGSVSRTGRLRITAIERNARVEYSVNGGGWSAEYAPVEGHNAVRVRQIDRAGNVSRTSATIRFTKKSSVHAVDVALRQDTGPSGTDRITWDGRLSLRGVEQGAQVEYSTDGGGTWRRQFTAVLGENRVAVRQVDRVGNVSAATPFAFTLVPRRSRLPSLGRMIGQGR